ncbi:transcriptional regulator [Actinacidiphila acididurans]|uniref:Transcriptional regulator n=1 Tax=Actinacidiphila acididurans TaxID=2784346 RepID=A0ABS2TXF7_9ACTN|nr:transcriptional regulator [Actinacidiphila acididurans]MBM9508037.1 transcriptional regulator [Actinacidiphila acididurans]
MHTADGGSFACRDTDRERRLAAQLADMIPGAATLRVSLTHPEHAWPQPHARAWNAAGERIVLSRTTAMVAARWVTRVWPEADWTRPHVLDLTTAKLICGDGASRRGR